MSFASKETLFTFQRNQTKINIVSNKNLHDLTEKIGKSSNNFWTH